jgi:hypothetical protein
MSTKTKFHLYIVAQDACQIKVKHVKFKEFDGMLIVNYKCQKTNPYTEIWIYINPTNQIYYESFSSFVKIIANEAGLIDGVLVQNATINPYTLVVFANAEAKTE